MTDSPIEDYLDDLLRHTHADPRSTRRLLDEAQDHLLAAADELEHTGLARPDAEAEAVRRFGAVHPLAAATRRASFAALVVETFRAALLLGSIGLCAVGVSGLIVAVMNALFGKSFVGADTVLSAHTASVQEVADDAVVLRVLAGLLGVVLLGIHAVWRRHRGPGTVLPRALVDTLGAAAFAAGTVALAVACIDQAVQTGSAGVGFALSGALVALPGAVYFSARAARELMV